MTQYHLKVLATFLKFWSKEAKATTKVTLRATNNNYSHHTLHKCHPTSKPLTISVEKKTRVLNGTAKKPLYQGYYNRDCTYLACQAK